MEVRKLIEFGGNSYVVSMPKSWVRKNLLKKGDLLAVEEKDDEITYSANNRAIKKEPLSIIIEADNKSIDFVKAEIIAAYLNNYDIIEIIANDIRTNAHAIKSILRDLTGIEIMIQSPKKIVAKDLLDPSEISIATVIKRMDFITRAMIDESMACIEEGNDYYDDVSQRDLDVNRLYYLSLRTVRSLLRNPSLMKALSMNSWQLHTMRYFVTRIEQIADQQKRIARALRAIKLHKNTREELRGIYNIMREGYMNIMKAYYAKDKKAAFELEVANKDRITACNNFLDRHSEGFVFIESDEKLKKGSEYKYWTEMARIVENLKAMSSSIKYLARAIIEID